MSKTIKNQNIAPKESKKEKSHTKLKISYHQGTLYLQRTIISDPSDDTSFFCKPCKDNDYKPSGGFCENIKVHLKNKNHKKTFEKGSFEEQEY